MKSTSMDCPCCGKAISQMPPACQTCGRTFIQDDYSGSYPIRWPLRLLFFFIFPLLAVGGFLITVVQGLLGFGFVFAGVIALPTHQVWGGASIAFGVGIFLLMMGRG